MFLTWTALIQSSDFTGVTTDVTTAATGIITLGLIVLGVGLLISVMSR